MSDLLNKVNEVMCKSGVSEEIQKGFLDKFAGGTKAPDEKPIAPPAERAEKLKRTYGPKSKVVEDFLKRHKENAENEAFARSVEEPSIAKSIDTNNSNSRVAGRVVDWDFDFMAKSIDTASDMTYELQDEISNRHNETKAHLDRQFND